MLQRASISSPGPHAQPPRHHSRGAHEPWAGPKGRGRLACPPVASARYEALILIDLGEPMPGQPALLKRRERVPRKQAVEQWKMLQKEGWGRVEPQW